MVDTHEDTEQEEIVEEKIEKKGKVVHLKNKAHHHLKNLFSTKKRGALTITGLVVLVALVLFAIPFTRYGILGQVIKKEVSIKVIDAKTKKPVTNATVRIGETSADTNNDGVARFKAAVGQDPLVVSKRYYDYYSQDYTVPVIFGTASPTIEISALGRQVPVSVVNSITFDSVENVTITSGESTAITNDKGEATITLPPANEDQKAVLSKDGYNSVDVVLLADDQDNTQQFTLTPAGSVYYLSKATGKIDVMKADLDGKNATVVVQATGQESDYETSLLSSRDWKYSALRSTRTDNKQRMYLVDAAKGDFTVMDEGNATFSPIGWSGHNFIYQVDRTTDNFWDNRRSVLKSFDAENRKISVLDETVGAGTSSYDYKYEYFSGTYILQDEVVYLKDWSFNQYADMSGKSQTLNSVNTTNGAKKVIKTYPINSTSVRLYAPQELYIRVKEGNNATNFYEYENKAIKDVSDLNDNKFYGSYPTFLVSPSGKKVFWYEYRDGKNTLFIGDDDAGNAKTIGNLTDYTPYGWFGSDDQYILLTRGGSELYIADASKTVDGNGTQPIKVTNYHKTQSFNGYGYGYGGQ